MNKLVYPLIDLGITKTIAGLVFKKGSEFFLDNGGLKVRICDSGKEDRHIVYVHVADDKPVYVGESSHTFCNRMRLYIIHTGSTNVRVREFIKQQLADGKKVETYYYKPVTILIDGVLEINPYNGIEQAIIRFVGSALNKKDVA